MLYITSNDWFNSCNGKKIFIQGKMEYSIRLSFDGHFPAYKYFYTIALINVHYLYNETQVYSCSDVNIVCVKSQKIIYGKLCQEINQILLVYQEKWMLYTRDEFYHIY